VYRIRNTAIGLSAALLTAAHVFAQEPGPQAAAPPQSQDEASEAVDEVVVRGRRLSEIEFDLRRYVLDFVIEVAAPPAGRGYARWQRNVCIGVHNLEQSAAQYIVDRISHLAVEVGLEPGEPGCDPEVIIIFGTNAKDLAARLVDNEPRLFRPGFGVAGINLDLAALDDFAQSDRAVRWWHVSLPVDARTGMPAIRLSDHDAPPVVTVAGPSRIYSGVRDDLQRVIIIVDATKLTGTTWQQLGDYLAMVSLAQIDPKANPAAFDSILNLFSNPGAYSGLTDWDRSYMQALYTLDQERIPTQQRGALVSRMATRERQAGE
jgi:hypothetical protein